ncbi:MAG: UPF0158 family protein [Polyangiaceae bacterium]|nr:UPF0158 family protein [Polyangiaceae bacterium]
MVAQLDTNEAVMDEESHEISTAPLRDVPVEWEALENAFENNAPEVHSYLHVDTGDVLRVVDGVADPQMHARIASDPKYLRIEAVSSREQYRWMERYIPTVEEPKLRARLELAIDGKGAFRRFKDVLMSFGPERERWFTYRSERLKTFMEAWLQAHCIKAVPRVQWTVPPEEEAPQEESCRTPVPEVTEFRRTRSVDGLRKKLRELADQLGPRDLDGIVAFAEFLKSRRNARSFAHHQVYGQARRDEICVDSYECSCGVDDMILSERDIGDSE